MVEKPRATATEASVDRAQMHALYRHGGEEWQSAPHVVNQDAACPHEGCEQTLQAIDFRLKDHGSAIHYPLVRAWWNDRGSLGRCPACGGWIQFTIRTKQAVSDEEAEQYPKLPDNWHVGATIL
jgi:hypothetical protein